MTGQDASLEDVSPNNAASASPDDSEDLLDEAIAHLEELRENGVADAAPQTLAKFPTVATGLQAYLACSEKIKHFCEPLRQALAATDTTHVPPQLPGYENLQEIGRGGMGIVYRARQVEMNRDVAIKFIRSERLHLDVESRRQKAMAWIRVEAKATPDHVNIVRIYHAGEVDGQPYLVMEYVPGQSLRERIRHRELTLEEVIHFLEQAATALHHAHNQGILHRDIKPANLLIDASTDNLKLADFGLAKLQTEDAFGERQIVGTAGYMAPEQLQRGEVTVASDIYGLGATLYEALVGQPPVDRPVESQSAEKTESTTDSNLSVRRVQPNLPAAVDRICSRCLQTDPAKRFASAAELADALRQLRMASHSAVHFANMGWLLMALGAVLLLTNLGVHALLAAGSSELWIWLTLFGGYPALFLMFWKTELPERFGSAGAKRELWSIWLGNSLAGLIMFAVVRTNTPDIATTLQIGYPIFSAIIGLCLFVMGANFWRYHYAIGLGWFAVAGVMCALPEYTAAIFGVAGCTSSVIIGCYELHLLYDQALDTPLVYQQKERELEPVSGQSWEHSWANVSILSTVAQKEIG